MNRHFQVIRAIVVKDIHDLLPLILLGVAVFVLQPVIANLDFTGKAALWSLLQIAFYWLGYFVATFLMISAVQLDPAQSLDHDWLTRPIARIDWLLAKLLFLALTVSLPIVLARLVVNLGGYPPLAALGDAVSIRFPAALLATPILFAIALLTPTFKRTIFVLVLLCLLFMIPGWDGGRLLLSRIGIDIGNDFGTMMWLQALPILVLGVASALAVYWLLYCHRRPGLAWSVFGISFLLILACLFPPASLYGWNEALAIHERMINDRNDSSLGSVIRLEHTLACFPAAPADGDASVYPLLERADWDPPVLAQAGPGALTFGTVVAIRHALTDWFAPSNFTREIGIDWRIDRIRVRGRLTADSLPHGVDLVRSRTAVDADARLSSVDASYWLVPEDTVALLADDLSTRLTLEYDLALLSPTPHELVTDTAWHDVPQLGSCRASIDNGADTIEIECRGGGARPALVSAELVGVPGSRVDSYWQAAYAPDWLESIASQKYELTLKSPHLVDSSVILLTTYEVARILHERVESPGLLGAPLADCPLYDDDPTDAIERSSWKDTSPHEVSSIAVERGVRVEVLDWRASASANDGNDRADRPELLLIPGLGATAHMYDDLATSLADRYAVAAMTRRGIGGSSRPDHGYDIARLSRDVIEVADTLGLRKPILIGTSIGGEELNFLGANLPERFAGLVYLDAAYDRATSRVAPPQPAALLPSRPPPRPSDLLSYQTLKQYYARTSGSTRPMPEGEVIAMYELAGGAIVPRFDTRYLDAIEMGLKSPDYARIALPALAIYAVPTSPETLMEPWYDHADPAVAAAVAQSFAWQLRVKREQIARFSAEVTDADVLILDDAEHAVILSNEQDVIRAIDAFAARLQAR